MICDLKWTQPATKAKVESALDRLQRLLGEGKATAVVGPQGALTFRGWNEREGIADACAYRRLLARNSPELRRALARAEALAGRKVNARAIAAGHHSHDGGTTWSDPH